VHDGASAPPRIETRQKGGTSQGLGFGYKTFPVHEQIQTAMMVWSENVTAAERGKLPIIVIIIIERIESCAASCQCQDIFSTLGTTNTILMDCQDLLTCPSATRLFHAVVSELARK
jgi:hypothetical protein